MKKIEDLALYIVFLSGLMIVKITPYFLIYRLSDCIYFLLYHVFRFRKDVVYKNLKNAFPNKSSAAIDSIAKQYYHNIADIIIEALKGFSMPACELEKRWQVLNPEILNDYYDKGMSVILVAGHCGNWEWGIVYSKLAKHYCIDFYKTIKNPYINDYMLKYRSRFPAKIIPLDKAARTFLLNRKRCCLYLLFIDQNPTNKKSKVHWMHFLNQDSAVIKGAEIIAKKLGAAVVYGCTQRVKRGYYQSFLTNITANAKQMPDGEITEKAMKLLEKDIEKNPSQWLWSHKRWKLKRQQS